MRYQPGQIIDGYEIIDALGEGAYAEVYKARDVKTGAVVLVKSPNPVMFADPQVYQRFTREADIASRLDHQGVQRSLGFKKDGGEPFLVLEYVEGEMLRRHAAELEGGVPAGTALDWGKQLARALAYLHANGIVHRDLKPENILITAEGRLKIVDFGTALMTGARRLTWRHFSESIGTPDYMSPEQIQGERGDSRSDIYSWGVMMYEFLTGRVPFEGDNWLAVMAGHLRSTPRRIRDLRPEISPALEAVVLKAMRRYPEHRYQSAEELIGDLDNLDALDPSAFDLSPEEPMGGMTSAARTGWQLWGYMALIALGFIVLVVIVVIIARWAR